MDEREREEIAAARALPTAAILDREKDLQARALSVDALVRELLREIGRGTVGDVYATLRARLAIAAEQAGPRPHR